MCSVISFRIAWRAKNMEEPSIVRTISHGTEQLNSVPERVAWRCGLIPSGSKVTRVLKGQAHVLREISLWLGMSEFCLCL